MALTSGCRKPATVDEKSPLQCAGLNRHEAENAKFLRERSSDPLGPESCAATVRDSAKRRQGYRRGGRSSFEKMKSGSRRLCNAREATRTVALARAPARSRVCENPKH